MHTGILKYVYTCVYLSIFQYIHVYVYMYVCIYIYIYRVGWTLFVCFQCMALFGIAVLPSSHYFQASSHPFAGFPSHGVLPVLINFNRLFHSKPSIFWVTPHFIKPPFELRIGYPIPSTSSFLQLFDEHMGGMPASSVVSICFNLRHVKPNKDVLRNFDG